MGERRRILSDLPFGFFQRQSGSELVPYSIQFWKMEKQLKIDVEKKQTM
ncbi:MAG: hypothetical protein IJH36_10425 [Clostridia bacterium]|nr:hypothetical protein [Clostridia bacterium]MBQ6530736.1 hypothetical protein [Clostridia bacterium]